MKKSENKQQDNVKITAQGFYWIMNITKIVIN